MEGVKLSGIDRRTFMKLVAATPWLISRFPMASAIVTTNGINDLLTVNVGTDLMLNANCCDLDESDVEALYQCVTYLGKRWELIEFIPQNTSDFADMLSLKCSDPSDSLIPEPYELRSPKYLAEYKCAAKLVKECRTLNPGDHMEVLFSIPSYAISKDKAYTQQFLVTSQGHFRKYFLDEMIRYVVCVKGGFKAKSLGLEQHGVINYQGYIGGPITEQNLPYRKATKFQDL